MTPGTCQDSRAMHARMPASMCASSGSSVDARTSATSRQASSDKIFGNLCVCVFPIYVRWKRAGSVSPSCVGRIRVSQAAASIFDHGSQMYHRHLLKKQIGTGALQRHVSRSVPSAVSRLRSTTVAAHAPLPFVDTMTSFREQRSAIDVCIRNVSRQDLLSLDIRRQRALKESCELLCTCLVQPGC